MKRIISLLILIAMACYGLGRMGLVSYLYESRHELAYTLGITTEKVIAICKGDYYYHSKLNRQQADERPVPAGVTEIQEIILGCPALIQSLPLLPFKSITRNMVIYYPRDYHRFYSEIFHPPGALLSC